MVQETIQKLNPGKTGEEIEKELTDCGGYESAQYLDGDMIIVIGREPGNLTRISRRKAWLKWWDKILPRLTEDWGKIKISPSLEYDRRLKFVGK